MSSFAYGAVTTCRKKSDVGVSTTSQPPGVGTYLDALAALVPAEVIAVHGFILSVTTKTENDQTSIADPGTLRLAFWAMVGVSMLLYALGRGRQWDGWDAVRILLPPLAFIAWTMLQQGSAYDAVSDMSTIPRQVWAALAAVVLAALAVALGKKADQHDPNS